MKAIMEPAMEAAIVITEMGRIRATITKTTMAITGTIPIRGVIMKGATIMKETITVDHLKGPTSKAITSMELRKLYAHSVFDGFYVRKPEIIIFIGYLLYISFVNHRYCE